MPDGHIGARSLPRDLVRFGSAIVAATILSAVQVFVIPRRLDITTYGHYRVFLLFVNYFGLLNVGITDGAYLRWAGRPAARIVREWRSLAYVTAIIQATLVALSVATAMFVSPMTGTYVIAIAVGAALVNLSALSSYAFQAMGDFRRAGTLLILAPAVLLCSVLLLPRPSLAAVLACYVGSFAAAVAYGAWCLLRMPAISSLEAEPIERGKLIAGGVPVLAANLAGGLSQSVDRILVSTTRPIATFALYGFAATVSAATSAVTNTLSRVSLSHAAQRPLDERARFLGGFFDVIVAGFGLALIAEPAFERVVAAYLPAYRNALPIVRALALGLPLWVAIHVVLVGTLQSYGHVRRQMVIELTGVAVVAALTGVALFTGQPLWIVAAASTSGALLTLGAGSFIMRSAVAEARAQNPVRFVLLIAMQGAALLVALNASNAWWAQAALYAILAAVPTIIGVRAVRVHGW